jgi:hypothetical protein
MKVFRVLNVMLHIINMLIGCTNMLVGLEALRNDFEELYHLGYNTI